jgi:lipid A ethanolaminephosphotransferase
MNTYHVVIDSDMIRNAMQTDLSESVDLFNINMLLYLFLLGLIPSILLYRVELKFDSFKQESFRKIKTLLLALLVIIIILFSFSKFYTSFFREHKPLRYYTNPTYWIYSIGDYIAKTLNSGDIVVKPIGLDAKITTLDNEPKLLIMVVGEASRADHFSLNGYSKETNPLLKREEIINLPSVSSCGTSTAHSVPCMFSIFDRQHYSYKKGISTENVLDVLKHTNQVEILWRDNNSNSKGVALRVPFEDYRKAKNNTICDKECRDEGMLVGIKEYINQRKGKNIIIVLHQMGNHGPAYNKRYTKEFEKFTPVCQTNQLEECSQESINNAYDNALLYTDYFLSKVIHLLKSYETTHKTSMIYMSDHGESLGEHGLYLHGLPYFMAPDAQTHVGAIVWFGKNNKKIFDPNKEYSHDNLFHTILGLFDVQSEVYNRDMDMFK